MLTGAERVVRCLEQEQVSLLFAYPGATAMELHHALLSSSIRVVRPAHEQAGAFMAGGYARRTGRTGVCISTSGPGATNLVTGIMDAWSDSVPTVFLCCQVDHHLIGSNAFQETDIIGMTHSCVKHSYLLLNPAEIPQVIHEAFVLASSGRRGPVVIDIPQDVLQAPCAEEGGAGAGGCSRCLRPAAVEESEQERVLGEVFHCLRRCHRPCIYAGGGVIAADASGELRGVAERFQIPVATSLMGIGAFPEEHPLSLGLAGLHGRDYANRALRECDFLLGVGVRFSNRFTGELSEFAPAAKILHIDIDPSEINKNVRADWALIGSAKEILKRLLERRFKLRNQEWLQQLQEWKAATGLQVPGCRQGEIHPQRLLAQLRELTQGQATLVTGVGQHQMWAAQFYGFQEPRQLLTSGGLGAMGFGLPAAIGAVLARPESLTILIDGDGSFQMNIQELATLAVTGLPLKMLLLNNQRLGMVCQWEDRRYGGVHAFTDNGLLDGHPYPDFTAIVRAYGIRAERVSRQAELDSALRRLLETPGAGFLEVMIASQDVVSSGIGYDVFPAQG